MEDETNNGSSEPICRICLLSAANERCIIKPCNCSGTMAVVHTVCLEKWISMSCRRHCELCNARYRGKIELKYGVLCSIPRYVWAKKTEYGVIYCYVKIWLYLYILYTLLQEYATNMKTISSSAFLIAFLGIAFCAGLFLSLYSVLKCIQAWNRWRCCQFRFVLDKDDVQQV